MAGWCQSLHLGKNARGKKPMKAKITFYSDAAWEKLDREKSGMFKVRKYEDGHVQVSEE